LLKILCSAQSQYTQNNPISSNNGSIKNIFYKALIISITICKKVNNKIGALNILTTVFTSKDGNKYSGSRLHLLAVIWNWFDSSFFILYIHELITYVIDHLHGEKLIIPGLSHEMVVMVKHHERKCRCKKDLDRD
jgi:hypothetical protein